VSIGWQRNMYVSRTRDSSQPEGPLVSIPDLLCVSHRQPCRWEVVHFYLTPRRRIDFLLNPPTGRLGIVHSSLQRRRSTLSNPPTGRLGIGLHPYFETGS